MPRIAIIEMINAKGAGKITSENRPK